VEYRAGSNPLNLDSDGDGLTDADELDFYGSSPASADSDADGLDDLAEILFHHSDPWKTDTDGDGFTDAGEVAAGMDPSSTDSDGDRLIDTLDNEAANPGLSPTNPTPTATAHPTASRCS